MLSPRLYLYKLLIVLVCKQIVKSSQYSCVYACTCVCVGVPGTPGYDGSDGVPGTPGDPGQDGNHSCGIAILFPTQANNE